MLNSTDNTDEYIKCLNTTDKEGSPQNAKDIGLSQGKYYFMIDNTNSDHEITSISIQIDGDDETGYLEFDNLTKCTDNEIFEKKYGILPQTIEDEIPIYDYNGYFKYNYIISADKLIEDPLDGKTFFDENHVCNKYTIGQPNLIIPSDSSVNSRASSIDVMNNRG